MDDLADRIAAALRPLGRPERAEGERAYLKSSLEHWGVAMPGIRKTAKAEWKAGHGGWRGAVVALWEAGVHEQRMAAVEVLRCARKEVSAGDLGLIERMIRESKTWALVDPLAIYVTGALVSAGEVDCLDRWAADDDFWVRRASMLCLLEPLRAGGGDWERFTRYAAGMLGEREFFIRKAIGWVLRDTSRKRPNLVAAWVRAHATEMAGLTFREATKRLPDDVRAELKALRG